MEDRNPYAELTAPPAAFAAVTERATFLRKVYGLLFLGVLGFAATLWAAGNVPVVHDAAMSLGRLIYGNRWGWAIYLGLFYAGSTAVHWLAEKRPINAIAYAAWVLLLGFLVAPLVLIINSVNGPEVIQQASTLTALVFGGLTLIVFWTGKDFSFLRGALMLAGFALLAVGIAGAIFGFTIGLWFSAAIVVLMAGYVLYDTSSVLHKLPTTMAMTGAILLFTDIVLLFKHILILLARSRR
jgi:uncharacterized protein